MKRIVSILILALYLVFSAGLTVSYNYCGDTLSSVSLNRDEAKKPCCEKNKIDKSCCHSTISYLKITDSQSASKIAGTSKQCNDVVTISFPIFDFTVKESLFAIALDLHKDRHSGKNPLYLRNNVFRI